MSTTAVIARNEKRKALVEKYSAIRAELKKLGDYEGVQKLQRHSAQTRERVH